LEAEADRLLAAAEGVEVEVIQNRKWRKRIVQGPSYESLAHLAATHEEATDTQFDVVGSNAFRSGTHCRRGGPARTLDRDHWNAILSLAPRGLPGRDVLILSAQQGPGESEKIAAILGISGRRVRQIQDALLSWARSHLAHAEIAAHLDDPITTEVVARRQPSRAGRKPTKTVAAIPRILVLVPKVAGPVRAPRPYKPRRPRVRPVCEGQMAFEFLDAA
jgi:hypothetical protein